MTSSVAMRALAWATALMVAACAWRFAYVDNDTFWYLAAGHHVMDNGALPARDPFSYASVSEPWVLQELLVQVGFAWLDRTWGMAAVQASGALSVMVALVMAFLLLRGGSLGRVVGGGLLALVILVDAQLFQARGQAPALVGVVWLVEALLRVREGRPPRAWLVVLVAMTWVHVHPSALLAVVLPLVALLAHVFDPPDTGAWRSYAAMSAWALLGTLASPVYGPRLLASDLALLVDETTSLITLFRSPPFNEPRWLLAGTVLASCVVVRAAWGRDEHRRSDVAWLAAMFVLGAHGARYVTIALMVAAQVMARALEGAELEHPWWKHHGRAVVLVLASLQVGGAAMLFGAGPVPVWAQAPREAAAVVERVEFNGNVFNEYSFGGYLSYRWRGNPRVFIDGRNNLFHNGVFVDMLHASRADEGWQEVLDVYRAAIVLIGVDSGLDRALAASPAWVLLHRDELAAVYGRRGAVRLKEQPSP